MQDFVVALGLVLVIEGLCFAAFPQAAQRAMAAVADAPQGRLRLVGLIAACGGTVVIWLVRGGSQ